ncbi:hypothetical protein [Thiomicrorhabdus arctica]|uniref:hypothetical protein n=1 Tax=Thiomicrorhabdus arctica TaxID=131540 RepID=UPI00035E39DB|nr:hypothetical protein [Thiomicrorhabdus arctica]
MKTVEFKVTVISILVTVIGITVGVYSLVKPNESYPKNITASNLSSSVYSMMKPKISTVYSLPKSNLVVSALHTRDTVNLDISATGANVRIEEGELNFPFGGGTISSTGAEQVIYLPRNQKLFINLSGTGAQLSLAKTIAKQVSVNNIGTGSQVLIF